MSQNLHRRHLDESQRAMVAAGIANMKREDTLKQNADASIDATAGVSQDRAAKMLNVSRPSVQRAVAVLNTGTPELQQAVKDGDPPPVEVEEPTMSDDTLARATALLREAEQHLLSAAHLLEEAGEELDAAPAATLTANLPWDATPGATWQLLRDEVHRLAGQCGGGAAELLGLLIGPDDPAFERVEGGDKNRPGEAA